MKIVATSVLVLILGAGTAFASTGHRNQRLDARQSASAVNTARDTSTALRLADTGYHGFSTATGGSAAGFIGAN